MVGAASPCCKAVRRHSPCGCCSHVTSRADNGGSRHTLTRKLMSDLRTKWNERHAAGQVVDATPCAALRDFAHLLPKTGKALDVACGLGGNAVFLARSGLETLGVDFADVAVEKLNAYAEEQTLNLRAEQADLGPGSLKPGSFDVIVVAYFLDRAMSSTLMQAVRSG